MSVHVRSLALSLALIALNLSCWLSSSSSSSGSCISAFTVQTSRPTLTSSGNSNSRHERTFLTHLYSSSTSSTSTSTTSSTTSEATTPLPKVITEEDILRRNQGHLTMPTKQKRTQALQHQYNLISQQSTSNSSPLPSQSQRYQPNLDKEGFGAVLITDGICRINNVLSPTTATEMIHYIDQLLIDTTQAVKQQLFTQTELFGNVHANHNRWDILLPFQANPTVLQALYEALHPTSNLSNTIASTLGPDAQLFELACMVSDPGAPSQPLHPDSLFQDTPHSILTCFIALQDVDSNMGPTVFMPHSATKEHHFDLQNRHLDTKAQGLVATSYNEIATLSQGDCSIYSSMTLHCGGANRSINTSTSTRTNTTNNDIDNKENNQNQKRRRLFYVSFKSAHVYQEDCRSGASIRTEVEELGLTLESMQEILMEWKHGVGR